MSAATAVAATATGLLTLAITWPLAQRLAAHGLIAEPNHRSMHTEAVPRGGGAGVVVAVSVVTLVGVAAGLDGRVVATLAVALGLAGIGFLDDRFNLAATPRLIAQLAVAGLAVAIGRDLSVSNVSGWPLLVTALVAVVWVMGCCNAVNFMDGIDAITGFHMVVFGVHLLILGYDDDLVQVPAALIVGAAVGFLYWNVVRSKAFLGDGGAYFIGAYLALLVVLISVRGSTPLIAAAAFAIYAADTSTTFARRLRQRANVTQGHRDHVYQRLVLQGRRHLLIAAFAAGCSAVCSAAAIGVAEDLLPPVAGCAIVAAAVVVYLSAPRWMPAPHARTSRSVRP